VVHNAQWAFDRAASVCWRMPPLPLAWAAVAWIAAWTAGVVAPISVSAGETKTGTAIYQEYCSVCHGDRGDGKGRAQGSLVPPPRDFTTPRAAVDLTLPRMLASVRDGRPSTAMTGWKHQLSDTEIEEVVAYIREAIMMPVASEDAEYGRRVYADTCSVCHGDDGRGARWAASNLNPRPRNFTLPATRNELTRGQMINAATYGKPDTAMPGFSSQLSQEDIGAVIDYIVGAFFPPLAEGEVAAVDDATGSGATDVSDSHIIDMTLAMPRGLVGDPRLGQGYYMANCVACHGIGGDGQGPRAYFILPKPRNFQHPGSRQSYNRPTLFRAIARGSLGTEMPAWDTVLNDQQIADLAEYVFQAFISEADEPPAGANEFGIVSSIRDVGSSTANTRKQ